MVHELLVFCKDLCEAKHEVQSVFEFLDVLFALKRHLVAKSGTTSGQLNIWSPLGQADLWSRHIPSPSRGI